MAKRKAAPQAQTPENMFPPIGEELQSEPTLEDRVKALSETVTNVNKALEDSRSREDRLQNLVLQLASARQPQVQTQVQPAVPVATIDFSKLPDPEKDPDGYRNGLQQQINASINAAVEARVTPQQQAQQQAQRVEQLWKDFTAKYEDLADFKDIAEVAAGQIVRAGIANGSTAEAVIFTDRDGFMEKVAKTMRDRLSAIRGKDEEDEDERPEPQRTLGIPGSTPGTGPGPKGNDPSQSTMLSELKEMQKGIYY